MRRMLAGGTQAHHGFAKSLRVRYSGQQLMISLRLRRCLRYGIALGIFVVLFGPPVGRSRQRLGGGTRALNQATLNFGKRTPDRGARATSAAASLMSLAAPAAITPESPTPKFWPASNDELVTASSWIVQPQALRGPPRAITL